MRLALFAAAFTLVPLALISPPRCPTPGQACLLSVSASGDWQTVPVPVVAQVAPMQRAIVAMEAQADGSWALPASAPMPKSALNVTVNGLRYSGADDFTVINPNRIQPSSKWIWDDGTPYKVIADYWF